ncbi:rab11 family-interacting protein 5-like isoform X2 [Haliotis rubra]|uniref:rab11 family-interacting protein 5-like isoform X2 n=1 Tax=Haliotis rubra TaxID=36100 RepID=UPI001EE5FEC0|nr:rab11 family-interacting protein 5-like isoform X2 [Haliotis rubra]
MWNPSHVQFTVLRARNLISKGKGGNNDVFVTIQLGKEKYQTSTIKNAHNPEWFEECDLPIPHMHSEIEVNIYHRGVLSDDFLGYASIPMWDHKVGERPKSQWVTLKNKPSKGQDNKLRGELEVKLTFHVESRTNIGPGLKKRSSSIRNLANAVGDKLGLSRSKSFRENRKDPEGSKSDRRQWRPGTDPVFEENKEEALSRSYSMSAAYIKSMSLDRGSRNINNNHTHSQELVQDTPPAALYIPGNRRSCVEFSNYTLPPPPYNPQQVSQDDTAIIMHGPMRSLAPRTQLSSTSSYMEAIKKRERAMYESIKERTEPEESSSSDEVDAGLARARPRRLFLKDLNRENDADVESMSEVTVKQGVMLNGTLESGETTSGPSVGNTGDFTPENGHKDSRQDVMPNGHARREQDHHHPPNSRKVVSVRDDLSNTMQSLRRENGQGEVALRKKSKRDRIRKLNKQGRRYTVQGLDFRPPGLYDDSFSDMSDSTKPSNSNIAHEDLMAMYRNLTKDELVHIVIQNKAQMIRKDRYIGDLESYIDDLLVRVMETQPRLLHRARPPRH